VSYRIYLSPPDVGELEEEFALDALKSGWVAPLGPHVDAFEQEIAEYVGVNHAVALSSGTAALHLGLLALGVKPGDEVVVPTMTFAATAFAVAYVGAVPVFIDSEPGTYNLDPVLLATLLSSRAAEGRLPAAVIAVDVYGQTADYERILPICAQHGVPVLEDAAEALGASHELGNAGTLGDVGVFSFNGNKIMTTSGGGMLVTNDKAIAVRVRHLATQAREPVPWYEHIDIGFNYRLSNLLAALGRAQLSRLDDMIVKRRATRDRYASALERLGIGLVTDGAWGRGNAWLNVALPGAELGSALSIALEQQEIESRPAWKPMHMQPVFASASRLLNGTAESLFSDGLCLPSGSALTDAELAAVLEVITGVVGRR
jgi:dTDP-4-amino-4,6-dideoxygalactose transaminase